MILKSSNINKYAGDQMFLRIKMQEKGRHTHIKTVCRDLLEKNKCEMRKNNKLVSLYSKPFSSTFLATKDPLFEYLGVVNILHIPSAEK